METAIADLFDRLYGLQSSTGDDGEVRPVVIGLSPAAKIAWVTFFNAHAQEQVGLSGDLSAMWSKLEGYAARFALVFHLARWAADDPSLETPDAIDRSSIEAGVRLARWFGQEIVRIYSILEESDEARARRRLIELIDRKGGSVTPRELMRSSRQWSTAEDAEAALVELVRTKLGQWVTRPRSGQGGRPTRAFVLFGSTGVDTTSAKPDENGRCVDAESSIAADGDLRK